MKKLLQKTIGQSISVAGVGLHSGKKARIMLRPAQENTGYLFVNRDTDIPVEIPGIFDKVTETLLATTISKEAVKISTVEHLIAAIRGMDIDNIIIEVEGGEVPIMDGSAAPFVYLLKRAGVVEQRRLRKYIMVKKELTFADGDKFIKVFPSEQLEIQLTIDFPHPAIGRQSFSLVLNEASFEKEIARARTFGFFKEVEYLKSKGLAQGGSLENAIVVGQDGIINREGLRYQDEFARHKILDLLGDIALLGFPVIGRIEAFKSGHALNNLLCRELFINRKDFKVVEFNDALDIPIYLRETSSSVHQRLS